MRKRIELPRSNKNSFAGIDVTWTRTAQRLDFGGWYAVNVGIQGDSMTLREFFDEMGITEADCRRAWKAKP